MDYWLHITVLFGIYATLAVSLNLAAGQTGLLSIAHAGFYGIGAYTVAILATGFGLPLVFCFVAAVLTAAVASIPIAIAAGRLRNDHFVVATLAGQALVTSVFENWIEVTGGPLGISGVPRVDLSPWLQATVVYAALALGLAAITIWLVSRLSKGSYGRVLHCIRDDEVVALSLGKDVKRFKLEVLALSGAGAGAAGAVYATYASFVDPSSFTLNESIAIAAMAIIGGLRTTLGPVLGAAALVLVPELLRFSGFPSSIAASLNQIIFGAVLVWIVMSRPQGLLGSARPIPG